MYIYAGVFRLVKLQVDGYSNTLETQNVQYFNPPKTCSVIK